MLKICQMFVFIELSQILFNNSITIILFQIILLIFCLPQKQMKKDWSRTAANSLGGESAKVRG